MLIGDEQEGAGGDAEQTGHHADTPIDEPARGGREQAEKKSGLCTPVPEGNESNGEGERHCDDAPVVTAHLPSGSDRQTPCLIDESPPAAGLPRRCLFLYMRARHLSSSGSSTPW